MEAVSQDTSLTSSKAVSHETDSELSTIATAEGAAPITKSRKDSDPDIEIIRNSDYTTKSGRISRPRVSGYMAAIDLTHDITIPKTYKEAIDGKFSKEWLAAMNEEMASIHSAGTWELVELPKGRKALGCMWVFGVKVDSNGRPIRFKARLVVLGNHQKLGIDYTDTFAPVAELSSVKSLLSIALSQEMDIHQLDIKNAFLNSHLNEEIFMKQPSGFSDTSPKVCKLVKGLYGLKQAPREWFKKLRETLCGYGLTQSAFEKCCFFRHDDKGLCMVIVYVDDILICSKERYHIKEMVEFLKKHFIIHDLGAIDYFLGIKFVRKSARVMSISQQRHIQNLLKINGLEHCNPCSTPYLSAQEKSVWLSNNSEDLSLENDDFDLFISSIGSLIYIMNGSRPDLAFSVNQLAQAMHSPTNFHAAQLKRVLRYIKGTEDLQLTLTGVELDEILVYVDSSFGGDTETRRSISGFGIWTNQCLAVWQTKRQPFVTLSTTESELVALCLASQQALALRNFIEEVLQRRLTVCIMEDNLPCIKIIENNTGLKRTRHMALRFQWIQEKIEKGEFIIKHCPSKKMIADIFTKELCKGPFCSLRQSLMSTNFKCLLSKICRFLYMDSESVNF